ncbi:LacI family DNA-binding transcriptional regulator [Paraburkholderia bengalensis]|uniref:LacI family DNA-binding transcriptional regulator n=1 Tax=Paraburkholderia bengalensis TaxID=2747562 RepID=UPI003015596A
MKSDESARVPTLKDVGKQAGVSYQTVSRVMNGSERVSPETRDLVMAAAQQLGFRVNRVAGSLRTNRSRTIGLGYPTSRTCFSPKWWAAWKQKRHSITTR